MSVRMRMHRRFFAGLENVFATGAATKSLKSLASRSTKGRRKVHADSTAFRVETLDPRVLLTAVPNSWYQRRTPLKELRPISPSRPITCWMVPQIQ